MFTAPVTVIVPCYNSECTISRAVNSILEQTLLPNQIIFVDDASTDNTIKILEKIKIDNPNLNIVILKLEKNGGPATARNAAWNISTQEYIAFLDSDDSWHPQKLDLQYRFMQSHPEAYLSGHFSQMVTINTSVSFSKITQIDTDLITPFKLLLSNKFMTRSVLIKKDILFRFKEGKRHSEDYLLWLEICLSNKQCYLIKDFLAFSYKDDFGHSGLSGQLYKMESGEIATYFDIFKQEKINFSQFVLIISFSLLKFLRRLAVSKSKLFFIKHSSD